MNCRLLLDTHVVVRWLVSPKKLSRDQLRILKEAVRRREPAAVSAITLLELAVLFGDGTARAASVEELLGSLQSNPAFEILPLTVAIAAEVASIGGVLRDPADRAIVATARVHRLRLVTSDQRIIESGLVSAVE